MEFSGSVLTPGQMNKAGTKAMPGKLLCLSKSFSRTDHIPMDLTVSTPKTWISFGDSLLFLCWMPKSWNVLEEPGFSSSFLSCPTSQWHPEGAMVLPSGEFLIHSSSHVLSSRSGLGQGIPSPFPASGNSFPQFWMALGTSPPS